MKPRSRNCAQRWLVCPVNRKKQNGKKEKERRKEKSGKMWSLGTHVKGSKLCSWKLNTCGFGRCKDKNLLLTVHSRYLQARFFKAAVQSTEKINIFQRSIKKPQVFFLSTCSTIIIHFMLQVVLNTFLSHVLVTNFYYDLIFSHTWYSDLGHQNHFHNTEELLKIVWFTWV